MTLTGAFGLLALSASAQISGVVTINSAAATAGTNYQTFTDLATALNTNGVNGPLTVNVVANSGPYTEQPTFNVIAGAGGSSPITINGNNNVLQFSSTSFSQPWTLGLNGTDYLTVNNLQVLAQGASYAYACVLSNGADNNSFTACTFSCPSNGTSSGQIGFIISSSMSSASSGGNSGSRNTITSCTVANGYYGVFNMGLTSAPYQTNNSFINTWITDFYVYGFYSPYQKNMTVKGCTIDRQTRASSTTVYGMYTYYGQGNLYDSNKMYRLYGTQTNGSSVCYCYYMYGHPISGGLRNTFRNNILTEINTTSLIYGLYCYNGNFDVYNNTLDLDRPNVSHSSTIYGMYPYGSAGFNNTITNNIITIRRPGGGTRYGMYIAATGNIVVERNNIVHTPTISSSYTGYYGGAAQTISQWQGLNVDLTAMEIDPLYTNQATWDLHPTNVAMNNTATANGLVFDQEGAVRNQVTPDIGALEFLSPACAGTPTANAVTSPTYAICPGENVTMGLSSLSPATGFTYQWNSSSVSNVGPFAPISGATGLFYTAPTVTANTYFQIVQTCTLPGGGSTSPVGSVLVAGPSSSVVPAYEDFEGIGLPNRLPNCSWTASGLGGQNQTYTSAQSGNRVPRSGVSYATFDNSSVGTSAYYTNPIAMDAGITYSAALWWATEYFGYNNWSQLSIWAGPNQSTLGMVQVASVSPALSGPYKLLDGLFTVPSTGNYYIMIQATSTSGSAQFLTFDDLSITIPCTPNSGNTPTVLTSASAQTVCSGQAISLTASGADTYSWSTGATGPAASDSPSQSGLINYYVMGTNTLTGCMTTVMIPVQVDPSPNVFAVANPPIVCEGSSVNMSAFGAVSYAWSNGSNGQNIVINPTTSGSYTVIGTAANGCSGQYAQNITVNALPVIGVVSNMPGDACKDDAVALTANGGVTYMWSSSTSPNVLQGNPVSLTGMPSGTAVFTVSAVGTNGCVGKATITQGISDCTGIAKNSALSGVRVFPNPTSGVVNIEFNSNVEKSVSVTDVTGRVIMTANGTDSTLSVNLNGLAAGIYYVKLQSESASSVVKVVKQ